MLNQVPKRVAATFAIGLMSLLFAGCSHTPKYTYEYTNGCDFSIYASMLVQGQGHTATGPKEIEPGGRRSVAVFSDDPTARATVIIEAALGDPDNIHTDEFAVGSGDPVHAPDPERPFELLVANEVCEGIAPGVG